MNVCTVCLNSNILCSKCASMVSSGKISETEVRVSRAVHSLGKETGMNIDFARIAESGGEIGIVADGANAGKLIGLGGRNVRRLSDMLGAEVRIIEDGPEKKIIENALRVPVMGVNKIFGTKEAYRIRIHRKDRQRAERSLELLQRILGKKVLLYFE